MTAGVIRDLLVLLAIAAVPAALALFLLRRGLSKSGTPFWQAAAIGSFALGGLAVLATWGAVLLAESELAKCRALPRGEQLDCNDNGLIVGLIAVPAAASMVIFLVGALVFVIVRKLRSGGGSQPAQPQ